jgi:hypothetical protein
MGFKNAISPRLQSFSALPAMPEEGFTDTSREPPTVLGISKQGMEIRFLAKTKISQDGFGLSE